MALRRPLAAALSVVLLLTACADEETVEPTEDTTEQPADEQSDADQDAEAPDDEGVEEPGDDTTDDAAAGGSQPATVAIFLNGERVGTTSACNGVDGAVVVDTTAEARISLVREEGTVLRYQDAGVTAESEQVEVEEVGVFTIYRATVESDELPATEISLELGDTSVLDDC